MDGDNVAKIDPPIPKPQNEARMEWLYNAISDKPPARQKYLIVQAAMEEVGFLSGWDAHVMLCSLGLEES